MAKTKNTSKCTVPKHKQRVTKKTIVSSKTKVLSKTRISSPRGGCTSYKRGEEVDFSELSHKIIGHGKYHGFKGRLPGSDSDSSSFPSFTGTGTGNNDDVVKFLLLINQRGMTMKDPIEITIPKDQLEEVNSGDMFSFIKGNCDEEDKALLEYEKGTWECSKCNGMTSNEGSYCQNEVAGRGGEKEVCGAPKPFDGKYLGWDGCFKVKVRRKCSQCTSLSCVSQSPNHSLTLDISLFFSWTCLNRTSGFSSKKRRGLATHAPSKMVTTKICALLAKYPKKRRSETNQ